MVVFSATGLIIADGIAAQGIGKAMTGVLC